MNIGVVELLFLLLVLGPGGLFLAIAFSPLAPLIRYCVFGMFGFAVAVGIAMLLGGTPPIS